jgi:hypothetical protein
MKIEQNPGFPLPTVNTRTRSIPVYQYTVRSKKKTMIIPERGLEETHKRQGDARSSRMSPQDGQGHDKETKSIKKQVEK